MAHLFKVVRLFLFITCYAVGIRQRQRVKGIMPIVSPCRLFREITLAIWCWTPTPFGSVKGKATQESSVIDNAVSFTKNGWVTTSLTVKWGKGEGRGLS